MKRHWSKTGILNLQRYVRTTKISVMIIALSVMYDQFGVTNPKQLLIFRDTYKEEIDQLPTWSPKCLDRVEKALKEVALTYVDKVKIRPNPDVLRSANDLDRAILYTEASSLYTAVLILRRDYKATYKQLDAFLNLYADFCNVYADGEQTSIEELAKVLGEIMGIELLGRL